jgi:hypothetical protein
LDGAGEIHSSETLPGPCVYDGRVAKHALLLQEVSP